MIKKYLTHQGVADLVQKMSNKILKNMSFYEKSVIYIYGVPRGGIPVAYFLLANNVRYQIVDNPSKAHVIVDDIIDSGATRIAHCSKYGATFYALIDKISDPEDKDWYVFPWEVNEQSDTSQDDIPIRFLEAIGEDPNRDGLKDTPKRIIRSWGDLYKGYSQKPEEALGTVFDNDKQYDQMVVLKDIEFYSTCEHHALPFFGKIHIAYLPTKKIVGISKLARLVEVYARRLQVQERLTEEIALAIMKILEPMGCGVVIEAKHFCMIARGIQKQNSVMLTSSLKGKFLTNPAVREEFLKLAGV